MTGFRQSPVDAIFGPDRPRVDPVDYASSLRRDLAPTQEELSKEIQELRRDAQGFTQTVGSGLYALRDGVTVVQDALDKVPELQKDIKGAVQSFEKGIDSVRSTVSAASGFVSDTCRLFAGAGSLLSSFKGAAGPSSASPDMVVETGPKSGPVPASREFAP